MQNYLISKCKNTENPHTTIGIPLFLLIIHNNTIKY